MQETIDCSQRQTINRLYSKMAKPSLAKTYSVVGRQDIAQEIVQEVFVKLWQKGGLFPGERAVYAWLFKSCQRAGIDYLRSASYRREEMKEDHGEFLDQELSFGEKVIARDLIIRAVKRLSSEEAEVLIYASVDRMTQVEIADFLGKSRRTIQRTMKTIDDKLERVRRDHESG